jgi:hypothetical protein
MSQSIFVLVFVTLCYKSNLYEGFQNIYCYHLRVGRVLQTVCNDYDAHVLSSAL